MLRAAWFRLAIACAVLGAGCEAPEPARQYPIAGQVLSVDRDRGEITLKHGDIEGLMPAMTMTFPVADRALLDERQPGDLVAGTLEVTDALGRLLALTRTGSVPLDDTTNTAMLAAGVLAVGDPVPDAALIDERDRRRSLSEWFTTPTLVTFIYTRCPLPNYCPLMDRNFAALQQRIAADPALRGRVRLLSISFDPDVDTPQVLSDHAARLGADPDVWTFLTGDRVTVDRVAARFGVGIMREADVARTITHNLRTVLLGADGRVAAIYPGSDWTVDGALADLSAAVRQP